MRGRGYAADRHREAAPVGINVSGTAVANGVASIAVIVVSINGCGMPAPGRPVILSSTVGALAATSGTTDAAGAFTTPSTATAAGNGTISATVDGVALAPTSVTFDPKLASGGGCGTGLEGGIFALLGVIAAVARRRRG